MAVPQNALEICRKFGRKGNTVRSSPEIPNQTSVVPRNGHNRSLHCAYQIFMLRSGRRDHRSSAENEKRAFPAETPQHYHLITSKARCQLSGGEKGRILPFIPFKRKLFVGFPVLKTGLPCGRLMVRKKVIPDMVSTPAGWAFDIFRFT